MVQKVQQKENITLQLNVEADGYLEVNILDPQGDLIYNYSDYVKQGSHNHRIKRRHLQAKPHLLRIAKDGRSVLRKVLI